jgi:putative flippase GtrA
MAETVVAKPGVKTLPRDESAAEMLSSVLKNKTDNTFIQLFRYTLVGGLAFGVDFSALFFCTEFLGIHYLWSAVVGSVLGFLTNYLLSVLWVFDHRAVQNRLLEAFLYALLGIVGLGINELFLYLGTELAGIHYLASKVVSTGATYLWNFASRKIILFPRSASPLETTAYPAARTELFAIPVVVVEPGSDR